MNIKFLSNLLKNNKTLIKTPEIRHFFTKKAKKNVDTPKPSVSNYSNVTETQCDCNKQGVGDANLVTSIQWIKTPNKGKKQ